MGGNRLQRWAEGAATPGPRRSTPLQRVSQASFELGRMIDTSAQLAILQDEPERRLFNEAIEAAESRSISVATFVEACLLRPYVPNYASPTTCRLG